MKNIFMVELQNMDQKVFASNSIDEISEMIAVGIKKRLERLEELGGKKAINGQTIKLQCDKSMERCDIAILIRKMNEYYRTQPDFSCFSISQIRRGDYSKAFFVRYNSGNVAETN